MIGPHVYIIGIPPDALQNRRRRVAHSGRFPQPSLPRRERSPYDEQMTSRPPNDAEHPHAPRYNRGEFARRGKDIYEQAIRPQVEPQHIGKFVAIDIETGDWEMDADDYTATERLLKLSARTDVACACRVKGHISPRIAQPYVTIPMIVGNVNRYREPVVRLMLHDAAGALIEIDAVVDTGFTGSLTLPLASIRSLGYAWRGRGSAELANGAIDEFDIYAGAVVWDGEHRNTLIEVAETEPLVGTLLLAGFESQIEHLVGGRVIIRRLSAAQ